MCVCCPLCRCIHCALRETSAETKGDKQSPLLFSFCRSLRLFCSAIASQSLCDSRSSCFSLTLSVSCGAGTNDRSVSAQSAVTETSLNLSLPVFHSIHPHLLSLSPSYLSPLSLLWSIFLNSLFFLILPIMMLLLSQSSSSHLLPPSPSSSACGVMIALGLLGSRLLPATFHTSLDNDWNWRCPFPRS